MFHLDFFDTSRTRIDDAGTIFIFIGGAVSDVATGDSAVATGVSVVSAGATAGAGAGATAGGSVVATTGGSSNGCTSNTSNGGSFDRFCN